MDGKSTSRKPGRQAEMDSRRRKRTRQPPQRILVVRTDRLGDLILSFPVIEALRTAYPSSQIDVLVNPDAAPLARLQRSIRHVGIDGFHGLRGFFGLVRWLRQRSYDTVFHLYPRPRLALAAFLAPIPVRVGTKYRYYSLLFNCRIPLHRVGSAMHERDLNLLLLQALGIPTEGAEAGIEIPGEIRKETLELLRHLGIYARTPLVVLHPGSGGSSLNWPPESFGRLSKILVQAGFTVLVTGTAAERETVRTLLSTGDGGILDLSGRLDLVHLAALLQAVDLVVSNSTGPLHLADALGTHVVGLYSPFECALPDRWGPCHQRENVLVPAMPRCDRCKGTSCKDYNCMERISPEEVFQKILEIRSRSQEPWPKKAGLLEGMHMSSAIPEEEEIL